MPDPASACAWSSAPPRSGFARVSGVGAETRDPDAQGELYAHAPGWIVESECDLRVGGRWTITFGAPGKEPARETNVFEQVERPRRLVFRSTMTMPDGSNIHTHVRVTFDPEDGKTRIRIVQRDFPSPEFRDSFESGWGSILEGLGRVSAAGSARVPSRTFDDPA
jgi:uncharacterized protein YndB with AHSA1/START domain